MSYGKSFTLPKEADNGFCVFVCVRAIVQSRNNRLTSCAIPVCVLVCVWVNNGIYHSMTESMMTAMTRNSLDLTCVCVSSHVSLDVCLFCVFVSVVNPPSHGGEAPWQRFCAICHLCADTHNGARELYMILCAA